MPNSPNILLIILDSVRSKNTGVCGYGRQTTPFLSKFSEKATLYTQARSPSIHSVASHASIFTGQQVESHGAIQHSSEIDITDTIWHQLSQDFSYQTGLFTPNLIVASASNLYESFDHVKRPALKPSKKVRKKLFKSAYGPLDTEDEIGAIENMKFALRSEYPIRSVLNCIWWAGVAEMNRFTNTENNQAIPGWEYANAFLKWQEERDDPWAACINLMDPHSPYVPEPEYDKWATDGDHQVQSNSPSKEQLLAGEGWEEFKRLENLYDGAILQSDQIVKSIIERLQRFGVLDNTLLIITSDHGEGFGEQSLVDPRVRSLAHDYGINEELTHVPLVVQYPGQISGSVEDCVVSLTSIPDTIRSVVNGSEQVDQFKGDGRVLSSTYRYLPQTIEKYESIDKIERYRGPWKAVYEMQDETVRKHALHDDRAVILDIEDTSATSIKDGEKAMDEVSRIIDSEFDDISHQAYVEGRKHLGEDLEDHLKDLGYIR